MGRELKDLLFKCLGIQLMKLDCWIFLCLQLNPDKSPFQRTYANQACFFFTL